MNKIHQRPTLVAHTHDTEEEEVACDQELATVFKRLGMYFPAPEQLEV